MEGRIGGSAGRLDWRWAVKEKVMDDYNPWPDNRE